MDTLSFIFRFLYLYEPEVAKIRDNSIIEIPNVSRLDLLKWFRMLDFKIGAEIGVAYGEYSKLICEINPQCKVFGVDSWSPYKGYTDYQRQSTFSKMEDQARKRMNDYIKRDRYQIIKKFSTDAAIEDFVDNSLDFVYIDANHEDPFVTQDIIEWSKKVRSGGIVAGHDYVKIKRSQKGNWGVKDAIDNYVKINNIKPLFILGTKEEVPGPVREGSRSWMYIKP